MPIGTNALASAGALVGLAGTSGVRMSKFETQWVNNM
jgi:flagellar basal body P-ring protein FlgI